MSESICQNRNHAKIDGFCLECDPTMEWKGKIQELEKEVSRMKSELAKYGENAHKSRCSYCGEVGSDDLERVSKHMAECKARPENALLEEIGRLEKENARYREALEYCISEIERRHKLSGDSDEFCVVLGRAKKALAEVKS